MYLLRWTSWEAVKHSQLRRRSRSLAMPIPELLIQLMHISLKPVSAVLPCVSLDSMPVGSPATVQKLLCSKSFVADPETRCQVFRRCEANNYMFSYICPNGTVSLGLFKKLSKKPASIFGGKYQYWSNVCGFLYYLRQRVWIDSNYLMKSAPAWQLVGSYILRKPMGCLEHMEVHVLYLLWVRGTWASNANSAIAEKDPDMGALWKPRSHSTRARLVIKNHARAYETSAHLALTF